MNFKELYIKGMFSDDPLSGMLPMVIAFIPGLNMIGCLALLGAISGDPGGLVDD